MYLLNMSLEVLDIEVVIERRRLKYWKSQGDIYVSPI